MLSVNDLNSFCKDAVAELAPLKSQYLVITESHLSKRLKAHKSEDSPFLVAVMPSAKSSASNEDALSWNNQLMFFILTKPINYTQRKQEDEETDYQATQDVADAFIDLLREKQRTCHWLRWLDLNNIEMDPEYNMYSCDGWSLTVNVKTPHKKVDDG